MAKEIHKIPKEGRLDGFYVLSTEWHEENIKLTVVDNDMTWTGKTDSAKITELCNALHKTKEDFLMELKHALSGNGKDFTFLMEEDNFIVKKVDIRSKIRVKFCSIPLERIPPIPIFMTIISELLDQDKINKSNVSKLSNEVQNLKTDLKTCMNKLQHFASEKATLETMLYSKFCEILNAKKRKISYLESSTGASGNSSPSETISRNISEHEQQSIEGPVKHLNENSCLPKRKCTKDMISEELNQEVREVSNIATLQVEHELDKDNSNHYDSDTDVETDDESATSSSTMIKASFCDITERSSDRILPKRTCSKSILPKRTSSNSILPKRVANISDHIKTQEMANAITQQSHTDTFVDEFNSQSLLDEY